MKNQSIWPGLALAFGAAIVARTIHIWLIPESLGKKLGEVIVAVILGLAIGNLARLPAACAAGLTFGYQTVLRVAIVLLGAHFTFQQALAIGGKSLLMIVSLMLLALVVAHGLGRLAGVPDRLCTLIGTGTAVCGNTAISAAAPVIGAKDEETSFAIATNTLFGTVAVFAYPAIGHLFGMSDAWFGTWAGTAVNDTSQVVATGRAFSDSALSIATVVKLTRNALMGAVIIGLGVWYGRRDSATHGLGAKLKKSVPTFVLVFVAMTMLNSLGIFGRLSKLVGRADLTVDMEWVARFLILVALSAVGLTTRFAAMRKIGLRPFAIGLITALTVSLASLGLIAWIGPASTSP